MNLREPQLPKPQYTAGDNIGITSSTCIQALHSEYFHYVQWLIPHPYLVSFLFIPSLYSLLFNSKNFSFSSYIYNIHVYTLYHYDTVHCIATATDSTIGSLLISPSMQIRDELPELKAIVQYKGELSQEYPNVYNVRVATASHLHCTLNCI